MRNPLESGPAPTAHVAAASTPTLTPLMQGLLKLLGTLRRPQWTGSKIHVSEVTAGAHFFYEQIRNAVEYREQHLFLRGAIERFLLRELKPGQTEDVGFELIAELTKTRYLANDATSEDTVEYLNFLIKRYGALQRLALEHDDSASDELAEYLVQLLSVELGRTLHPNPSEAAIVEFCYAAYLERSEVADEEHLSLYASIHKALLKSDLATIRYGVFSRTYPRWLEDDAQMAHAAQGTLGLMRKLAEAMQGGRSHRMFRLVRRHIAPYLILREIIKTNPQAFGQLIEVPSALMERARSVAEEQYQIVSARLRRSIIQAVIFLFITKVILGLLVEVPYELFILGHVEIIPLAINLLVPPTYMALVGATIKVPGQKNTAKILSDLQAITYKSTNPLVYTLKRRGRASRLRNIFNFLYGLTSLATLVGLSYLLQMIGFNLVSALIFFIFLSTVSFFAYRISYSVREYAILEEDPGFIANLSDFLLTPFIRTGQWLAERYSRINFFTAILDIIIETPFKTILRVIEQWNSFLRDKRDDVLR